MGVPKFILAFILGLIIGSGLAYFVFYFYSPISLNPFSFQSPESSSQKNDSSKENSSEILTSNVPILMYHYIETGPNSLYVSPSDFEMQMRYLYSRGYRSISLEDLFIKQPGKRFVITLDDGYKDAIQNAYPILEKFGFKATVFLIVNDIGTTGYLNWNDIKILKKDGWTIGSHTLNHHNLLSLSAEAAQDEIVLSKEKLETKLGENIDFFCYSFGRFNQDLVEMVKDAGYRAAVTTQSGAQNSILDTYQLKRVRISKFDTLELFAKKLGISQ